MKAVVVLLSDDSIDVTPYPDARGIPKGARTVNVPGELISKLQLANARLEQAEEAILSHLRDTRQEPIFENTRAEMRN